MLNTLVSLKSYVGTIIIFVLFIICFVVMVATMSVPNVKFLTIPLTISLGIALMNCVVYLNNIVKIREEEVDLANEPQQLNSCPEYWVKDTMYIKGENDEYEPKTICKNSYDHPDQDTYRRYVGGSLITSSSNQGSFYNNFKSSHSNQTDSVTLLEQMNAYSNTETFVDGDGSVHVDEDTGFAETSNQILRSNPEDLLDNRRVLFVGHSNYDTESNTMSNIPGHHYHFISSMTKHDNRNPLVEHGSNGAVFHWHDDMNNPLDSKLLSDNCASNWICKDEDTSGLIINLDKLNAYQDNDFLCKSAREFHWVEAMNKCDMVNK